MVRQDANRRRQLAQLAWESDHGGVSPGVEWYSEQIAPRLCELSLRDRGGTRCLHVVGEQVPTGTARAVSEALASPG
jgi:hypothetical protein